MEYIVIALLVVLVLAFIAYPLFGTPARESRTAANAAEPALDGLLAQRDSAYDAIRDLDLDHQMGKLSRADYELLRDKYKARAAAILQQIDQIAGTADAEARIEEEVARLRTHRAQTPGDGAARGDKGTSDAIEQEVLRLRARRAAPAVRCSNCGTPARPGDQFCAKCGNRL